jgi:hypothetical protein
VPTRATSRSILKADDVAHRDCAAVWDDPDWSILDDRRGELPEFPSGVLSPSWQSWVTNAAHGAGVTVEHVIVPLLCAVRVGRYCVLFKSFGTRRQTPSARLKQGTAPTRTVAEAGASEWLATALSAFSLRLAQAHDLGRQCRSHR